MTCRTRLSLLFVAAILLTFPHFSSGATDIIAAPPPPLHSSTLLERLHSLLGLVVFVSIAWGVGKLRRAKVGDVKIVSGDLRHVGKTSLGAILQSTSRSTRAC